MKPLKPIIALASILFVVILLIPTMLVIPFSEKGEGHLAEDHTSQPEKTQIASGQAVEVAVYRTNAQKIENVPLEEYVVGVLASEMPAKFEMEALKAQALAARTYIVKQMMSEQKLGVPEGAVVTDTVNHQVYKSKGDLKKLWGKDYDWKIQKITEAVAATQGKILTYDGSPITASFFSTSNGFTENSEDYWANPIPYLKSVESPWDVNTEKFADQKTMTVVEFQEKLGVQIGNGSTIGKITARTKSKRVATVDIGGKSFSGREIREKLDLKSTDFEIQRKGNHIVINTEGYGHGIGMSQYGANGMALEGKTYEEILNHYYQGIQISQAQDFLTKLTVKK